jgi:desulfoferrodoxin-like iron-binding protein
LFSAFKCNNLLLSKSTIIKLKGDIMAVKNTGENYKCNICGNEVTVTKAGGGELVCCGQPMEKISG